MATAMSTVTKKKLLAQYGPQCGNGNCKGPPECLLRHPNMVNKEYQLRRKPSRSRSSSAIGSNAETKDDITPTPRPRSSSYTKTFPDIYVDRVKADEGITDIVMARSLVDRGTTAEEFGAEKTEEAVVSLAIAKSLESEKNEKDEKKAEEIRLKKHEEATVKLAVAKSLEEVCPYCQQTFLNATEVQSHILLSHQDEIDIEIIEESSVTGRSAGQKDEKVAEKEQEGDMNLHEKIERFVQEVIQSAMTKNEGENTPLEDDREISLVSDQVNGDLVESLRDEVQQLKNTLKVMKTTLADRESTIQTLEAKVMKLEENQKNKELECKHVKKNLFQHQMNEKQFKEKSETLLSDYDYDYDFIL